MRSRRRTQAVVLFFLASLCVLLVMACTPSVKDARHQAPAFLLSNPTTVSAGPVSLAVGTQHWSNPASGLEEVFFPVAVTVRNGGNQPLCGGVPTATLGDSAGTSVSAIFPENVVSRLFGPLASVAPPSRPTVKAAAFTDQDVFLVLAHGSHGGLSGGMSPGGGLHGGTPGMPHLGPSPRAFAPQPFSSPFHSPVFPFTPGSQGAPIGGVPGGGGLSGGRARPPHWGPSPRVFAPPLLSSPFYSPFSPFAPSPFYSPFYNPFPPPYPYSLPPPDSGYGLSLPPNFQPREEERPEIDQALVKEILTTAFASRALVPQEERSGFLFFPLPVPNVGSTVLTWEWYDCTTHELVASLSTPIPVEKHA